MERVRLLFIFTFIFACAALCSAALLSDRGATNAAHYQDGRGNERGFSLKQYEDFHDVIHPLQHEALSNRDFKLIRAKSALLTRRGQAIVRLGVPHGLSTENRAEFASELKKFSTAITKYRADARRGTDTQLEASYSAVHDSFEMLVSMLPRS